jgi:hypothetical protein
MEYTRTEMVSTTLCDAAADAQPALVSSTERIRVPVTVRTYAFDGLSKYLGVALHLGLRFWVSGYPSARFNGCWRIIARDRVGWECEVSDDEHA